MQISARTWSQLFFFGVACAAQIHAVQVPRHSSAPAQIDHRPVIGRVVEAGSNKPLKNAVVAIVAASGDRIDASRTGADGTFVFPRVPSGQWNFEVITTGYQRLTKQGEDLPTRLAEAGLILALTKLQGS